MAQDDSEARRARRLASVPAIRYPEHLPVSERKDDIAEALRRSQVVVVAGETGSGKTTQLPKICLELGRGIDGLIGHTQPRRLAARATAERVAEELGTPLGTTVGYTVRFTDRTADETLVKVMTDGILLAEIRSDRELRRYDTLILDEAHERSLNIDFLLGYLARLLPRRPDLKLVITSATLDTGRFSAHFGGAPVVEVSGRTYPVEVRYRPFADDDIDQVQAIVAAVDELASEPPGDVLVFLSGEREIRDTADALRGALHPDTEVLPLFARLSAAEQHRVFASHPGRRIVLATNVAETSLTVPGIRYVVDPGTARISRYSARLKVQRLPIERVSRASAEQRKGRCGRVADGICIRLYSEDDYLSRPEYTDPEILRTSLASVILQMTALGLGDVEQFPFVDPPDRRQIRDGLDLLHELGALTHRTQRLTPLGRRLARLPVDPRLGRMVLEAERNGCVHEVLVLAAALSISDPRERPADNQQAADESHRRFRDEHSDFLAYLNLWNHLQEQQELLSSSAFRRLCRSEFLHYLRVREWQDLYGQLRSAVRRLGISLDSGPADPLRIHTALLAGLLSHIGVKEVDKKEYAGARGARFALWPGSALAAKPPRWVMAAELVETGRLWGRTIARITPEQVEPLAGHLVVRSYSEPRWDTRRGGTVASERVTLYGIPLVTSRRVDYGRVDPAVSRDLFIRCALVEGDWETHHRFWHDNRALLDAVADREHRVRQRGFAVDDETVFTFYDKRIPADVVSARHFDSWWKTARRTQPDLLTLRETDLAVEAADLADYPDTWLLGELALPLTYLFEPGHDEDGITAHVPLRLLNQVPAEPFEWQVPGRRHEIVTALLKSLPKAERVRYVPAPDTAAAALARMTPYDGPLLRSLERALEQVAGAAPSRTSWRPDAVPPHLRVTFAVEDESGELLARGKDLDQLRGRLAGRVRAVVSEAASGIERSGLRDWPGGELPRTFESGAVRGFPSLVDDRDSVAVRVLGSESEQRLAMWRGTRRLLRLTVPNPLRGVVGRLPRATKLALATSRYRDVPTLLEDCVTVCLDAAMADAGGPAWDEAGWHALRDHVRGSLEDDVFAVVTVVGQVLEEAARVEPRVEALVDAAPESAADARRQLDDLVGPGFVAVAGRARLPHVARYLQALSVRLDKLPRDVVRDLDHLRTLTELRTEWKQAGRPTEVRWMLEELRVSLFAPQVRTAHAVSPQRIRRALAG